MPLQQTGVDPGTPAAVPGVAGIGTAGERLPDVVIVPCGGGSNLGGIAFLFVPDAGVRLLAVEPLSCPTLTQGAYGYDFGDTAGLTPLMQMYTLGHDFMPPLIHAGGLRDHGDSPLIPQLVHDGRMEAVAYPQGKVFEAAVQSVILFNHCGHGFLDLSAYDDHLNGRLPGEQG